MTDQHDQRGSGKKRPDNDPPANPRKGPSQPGKPGKGMSLSPVRLPGAKGTEKRAPNEESLPPPPPPPPGPDLSSAETYPRRSSSDVDISRLTPGLGLTPKPDFQERPSREQRAACSFPGVLKVIFPEKSFMPTSYPVRVANISPGGAMVELHDSSRFDPDEPLTNRFFELKAAHPDIPELRGNVVWSDYGSKPLRLGLSLFERSKELELIVERSETAVKWEGPPPLPSPELDSFPPSTSDEFLVIRGSAREALEIVVRRDEEKFTTPVKKGRFEIRLPLAGGGENLFSLRSFAGERKSRSIPIRIITEKGMDKRRFFFDAKVRTAKSGAEQLELKFNGNVRQAERVLYRLNQLMVTSDRVTFEVELSTISGFEKRAVEALRTEGTMLAGDSTSGQAAKLLNELL